jgi:hypothetical protein
MPELRSYIVRIYRQGACDLTGMVEDPRTGGQRPFRTMQDLWTLLGKSSLRPTHQPSRTGASLPAGASPKRISAKGGNPWKQD